MTVSWSESRFVRPYISQLSPELVDLLNHVLHTDPDLVRACLWNIWSFHFAHSVVLCSGSKL